MRESVPLQIEQFISVARDRFRDQFIEADLYAGPSANGCWRRLRVDLFPFLRRPLPSREYQRRIPDAGHLIKNSYDRCAERHQVTLASLGPTVRQLPRLAIDLSPSQLGYLVAALRCQDKDLNEWAVWDA